MKLGEIEIKIPTTETYRDIVFEKYNLKELKYISKFYKLKTSFKKDVLIYNIKNVILQHIKIVIIQKLVRGWIARLWLKSHGPELKLRNCVNDSDFLTMEDIKDIDISHFFSYCDNDEKHSYGFNVLSFYHLIKNSKEVVFNPYNRKIIDNKTIDQLHKMLRLSKLLNININLIIENDVCIKKKIEFRSLDLFQSINELGNYSNHLWFINLQKIQLVKFIRELNDIWCYRTQLSREIQQKICPRGNPFRHINFFRIRDDPYDVLQEKILIIMEEMVHSGVDNDSRSLGCYYILGSLTLVSPHAAAALPWLYETFL
jgi:hypothetical protein